MASSGCHDNAKALSSEKSSLINWFFWKVLIQEYGTRVNNDVIQRRWTLNLNIPCIVIRLLFSDLWVSKHGTDQTCLQISSVKRDSLPSRLIKLSVWVSKVNLFFQVWRSTVGCWWPFPWEHPPSPGGQNAETNVNKGCLRSGLLDGDWAVKRISQPNLKDTLKSRIKVPVF